MTGSPSSTRKIAILQTAFLGDTLLSIPIAQALNAYELPSRSLALICRKGLREFFEATGLFDLVIEIEKGDAGSYGRAMKDLEHWWKDSSQKILVSPHESPRSKMWALKLRMRALFSGRGRVQTIGYRGVPGGLSTFAYSFEITRPLQLPEPVRQLTLLQAPIFVDSAAWQLRIQEFSEQQGMSGGRNRDGSLGSVPEWASMKIPAFASTKRERLVTLAPGSVWKTKQWTEEGFIEVGREFSAKGYRISVIGSKEEASLCERIAEAIGSQATSKAGRISLVDTTREIAKSEYAFVNDSGAMHLASLAGTPTIAFFGPTVLDFGYRPWNSRARALEPTVPLSCRPCGLHGANVCPIGTHACMKSISAVNAIAEAGSIASTFNL